MRRVHHQRRDPAVDLPVTAVRKLLASIAVAAGCLATTETVAAAAPGTTVSHYHAAYPCSCFGYFDLTGVHLTNQKFPGVDNGPDSPSTTGGRDNFSGTVTEPPQTDVTFTGPGGNTCDPDQVWESDYNPNLYTCAWSETINSDGTVEGWAIYPGS